jgi:hypothetical protein
MLHAGMLASICTISEGLQKFPGRGHGLVVGVGEIRWLRGGGEGGEGGGGGGGGSGGGCQQCISRYNCHRIICR